MQRPRLFPALRGKSVLSRAVEAHPYPFRDMTPEAKQVYTGYVSTLAEAHALLTGRRAWDIERAVSEAYLRTVWGFRAVEVIAGNQSRLPFQVNEAGSLDDVVEDHPVARLLNGPRANPLETGPQLRKRLSVQILLSPLGAFAEMTYTRRGHLTRIDLLPPARTQIVPGTGADLISHFETTDINGRRKRIDPERVRWFREPHPLDPYLGITPLEAAGLSVDLDYYARLYNAQFLANDGRPGGILAVRGPSSTGTVSEREMDRLEARFGKGPVEAGKLSVIGGDMTFIDPAAKPRDVHYPELSANVKIEILTAFGIDESIIGDTSGRTFDNADRAWENFWLVDPMPAHLNVIVSGFLCDIGDGMEGGWDTSEVEPLRRAQAARREEARSEVEAGLRSIKSYAELAGYGDEIDDSPQVHALWIPQGRTPIPSRAEDAKALGFSDDGTAEVAASPAKDVAAVEPDQQQAAMAQDSAQPPAAQQAPAGRSAADLVAAAGASKPGRSAAELAAAAGRKEAGPELEVKGVAVEPGQIGDEVEDGGSAVPLVAAAVPVAVVETDEGEVSEAEAAILAALLLLVERFARRTASRARSPKIRKGTPHFTPEYAQDTRVGAAALDTPRIVDEDTWADNTEAMAAPYVTAAGVTAAAGMLAALGRDEDEASVREVVGPVVRGVLDVLRESARRQARHLAEVLARLDQDGRTIDEIVATAEAWQAAAGARWARRAATSAAVAGIEGAHEAVLRSLVERGIVEAGDIRLTWRTRRDGRVRPTHGRAEGQTVSFGTPFAVGEALLRFPGDPLGLPAEVVNCRCFLSVSVGRMRNALRIGA